ncbi:MULTISPECIES: hypothetical protein [Bacillus]|nr:hypothetical protein [Bacillus cereus]EEK61991.1 hypothetical protein bcere0005_23250 [Bacillus cereus 172560W]MDA1933130.1 hypothetical protein [Bacillus cereus]MDA1938620.1 hypothetical protein [Bacillus cereus]MDZ4584596.1 hypothetical protein [Bacillus cereus]MDZ4595265.1 hypothetical protein [Bacillus cereus]
MHIERKKKSKCKLSKSEITQLYAKEPTFKSWLKNDNQFKKDYERIHSL